MTVALCPGSFDPVTNGHVDVIERVARLFDEVIAAVVINPSKAGTFEVSEREDMLHTALQHVPHVKIESFTGLLVDYAASRGVSVIVKGLRAVSDFDYELQMAQMNQKLTSIDTLFLATSPAYSFLSSSLVRDVARFGGDVSALVPPNVVERLREKFA